MRDGGPTEQVEYRHVSENLPHNLLHPWGLFHSHLQPPCHPDMLVLARTRVKAPLSFLKPLPSLLPIRKASKLALKRKEHEHLDDVPDTPPRQLPEHAVISTFDLFSIGGMSLLSVCCRSLSIGRVTQSGHHRLTRLAPCALGRYSSQT